MGLLYSLIPSLIFPRQEGCGRNGGCLRVSLPEGKEHITNNHRPGNHGLGLNRVPKNYTLKHFGGMNVQSTRFWPMAIYLVRVCLEFPEMVELGTSAEFNPTDWKLNIKKKHGVSSKLAPTLQPIHWCSASGNRPLLPEVVKIARQMGNPGEHKLWFQWFPLVPKMVKPHVSPLQSLTCEPIQALGSSTTNRYPLDSNPHKPVD